jgi:hypothetical protein
MRRPASDASGSAATITCRFATVLAGDGLEVEEAARAAPQINNDTASIANADANRFMNPASLKTRGLKLTRRATLGQCGVCDSCHRHFSAWVVIAAPIAYFIISTGK